MVSPVDMFSNTSRRVPGGAFFVSASSVLTSHFTLLVTSCAPLSSHPFRNIDLYSMDHARLLQEFYTDLPSVSLGGGGSKHTKHIKESQLGQSASYNTSWKCLK